MLDWFTTIPGILIICGVILLVIAIILFLVGAKKSKKEEYSVSDTTVTSTPSMGDSEVSVTETPIKPVMVEEVNSDVESMNLNTDSTITFQESAPVSEPEVVETPVQDFTVSEPVMEATDINIPDAPEMVASENSHPIYGGEVPFTDFSTPEEKPVTIYGGNDPLEATQTLPKMEEHHEPYGGFYPEAKIVEPNVSVEIPTPVEEVVSAMPMTEPVIEDIPEQPVIEIPDFESDSYRMAEVNSTSQEEIPSTPTVTLESVQSVPMPEEKKEIVEEL